MDNLPDIVTPKQLAEFLQISETTVKRDLKAGGLKGFKAGRDWRIEKEEVIKWVKTETPVHPWKDKHERFTRDFSL